MNKTLETALTEIARLPEAEQEEAAKLLRLFADLVGDTKMPSLDSLPPMLANFTFLNAAIVDPGRDFHIHMYRLIEAISISKPRGLG